jgi:glutathione S-transferase
VKLYVIPGSHACRSAALMLEHKGLAYRTIELPTGMHPLLLRALGFAGNREPIRLLDGSAPAHLALLDRLGTVPALRAAARRVQTNREIARFLEREHPEPLLFPADETQRGAVEEAERWGDEALQMAARRVALATASRGLDAMHRRAADGRLGPLLSRSGPVRAVASRMAGRSFRAGAGNEAALVAAIPPMLDKVDAWIEQGVLGSPDLNVADYMIVPSLALLSSRPELRAQIAARPAGALLDRLLPEPA